MWADAQRDGRPAEYKLRHLRKFRNSIPCTTPQSLLTPAAGVPCSNENAKLERKVDFAPGKIPSRGKSPRKCIYI